MLSIEKLVGSQNRSSASQTFQSNMLDRLFLIANEEYLSSQSGGGNDIKSDLYALQKIFKEVHIIALERKQKNDAIKNINKGVDCLFFSGFLSFERFFSQTNPIDFRKNLRITNIKDLHFFRELRVEMLTRVNSGNHKKIMDREMTVYKYSDVVLSYSDDEIRLISTLDNNINIQKHYYYNPHFPKNNKFKFNKNLIFIGNFEHGPNLDGIVSFDGKYEFNPDDFTFKIYGQHAIEKLRTIKLRNEFNIIGEINDPLECYSEGGLFISPIRFGGGIKIKIIEAALSKLPIVATPESVEGLNLIPGESYIPLTDNANFQKTLNLFKVKDPSIKKIADAGFNAISKISNEQLVHENLHALFNQTRP